MKFKSVKNLGTIALVFIFAVFIGSVGTSFITDKKQTAQVETVERVYEVKRDTLPLENGGEVALELIGNEKSVYISFSDLEFISKKNSNIRKFVKNLDALFARMRE